MPDPYAAIANAPAELQDTLSGILEMRAADPRQRAMLESYTAALDLAPDSRLLEIGCGTGAVSRFLATLDGVASVVGVDPSERFIIRANELADDERLDFRIGDGTALDFDDGSFDAVVIHTVLCHVPDCERILAEAHRVLRPGGAVAVFDNDPMSFTVEIREGDPLQTCIDAVIRGLVHDPWVMRRIGPLLSAAGFTDARVRSHDFTETQASEYVLSLVDRGADVLATDGRLGPEASKAMKAEARRRSEEGSFFAHGIYLSAVSKRP